MRPYTGVIITNRRVANGAGPSSGSGHPDTEYGDNVPDERDNAASSGTSFGKDPLELRPTHQRRIPPGRRRMSAAPDHSSRATSAVDLVVTGDPGDRTDGSLQGSLSGCVAWSEHA